MAFVLLKLSFILVIALRFGHGSSNKNQYHKHSEYASRIAASKEKFLPRSMFTSYDINDIKLGSDQELECKVRKLALQYAQKIQPFRDQSATSDALNIAHYCNSYKKPTETTKQPNMKYIYRSNKEIKASDYEIYVDPINGNDENNNGNINSPFLTIYKALKSLRSYKSNEATKQIIIRTGTVYLNSTIHLTPQTFDNNLLIRSYPNENVTISGGILLKIDSVKWERYNDGNQSHNIWMTTFNESFTNYLFNETILSLFTLSPHTRLTRARFPNGHVEVWGNGAYYINPYWVTQWYLPPQGMQYAPNQVFKDLSNCNITKPCLNKSHLAPFDTYTAGYGKLCDLWTPSYSYWCGNNTAGGWAEQDRRMGTEGIRQLPVAMLYNKSVLPEIAEFADSISTAIFYIRHSMGWNVFWWEVGDEYDLDVGNISFGAGGWQGGRVWTKTHDLNQKAVTNLPIMAGQWYIENVFAALDVESEWFYDKKSRILYYWPNNTTPGESPVDTKIDLVIGNLAHLFRLTSDDMNNPLYNVSFMDIEFRDTRYTYMDKWGVPSGGGWALFNGGAVYLYNTTNCTISNSYFDRLDGNVIMLYGYNRNTLLYRNEFTMIGDNVMAGWGYTDHWDGTNGLQPRFTYVLQNYVHEIGLYQLQSSAWFQAKTAQSIIKNNIIFNVPRAAINFNDAFGGYNNCSENLLFNTCTESGDHGPINSWDRMPFLTKLAHGTPSWDSGYSNVHHNFIFANYGASQGFDTDDGSSWYNIYNNFNWYALAYKNDYGGYYVNYYNNINVLWGNKMSTK
eukprot:56811_1